MPGSLIHGEELDWTNATPVTSSARKFIIPVSAMENGGQALYYPKKTGEMADTYETGYPDGIIAVKEGESFSRGTFAGKIELTKMEPIRDYKGDVKKGRGLVFYNGKDNVWQGVSGDGTGIIIINEVNEEQASIITAAMDAAKQNTLQNDASYDAANELQRRNRGLAPPNASWTERRAQNVSMRASKAAIRAGLQAAISLGLVDMYDSNTKFMESKLSQAGHVSEDGSGLYKRDDRDVNLAICMPMSGAMLQGPAGEPQEILAGDVVLQDSKGHYRKLDGPVFDRTWVGADGQAVNRAKMPVGMTVEAWEARGSPPSDPFHAAICEAEMKLYAEKAEPGSVSATPAPGV